MEIVKFTFSRLAIIWNKMYSPVNPAFVTDPNPVQLKISVNSELSASNKKLTPNADIGYGEICSTFKDVSCIKSKTSRSAFNGTKCKRFPSTNIRILSDETRKEPAIFNGTQQLVLFRVIDTAPPIPDKRCVYSIDQQLQDCYNLQLISL